MNSSVINLPAILKFDFNWFSEVSKSSRVNNIVNGDQRNLLNGLAAARIGIVVVAAFSLLKGLKLSTLVGLVVGYELFVLAVNYSRKIVANLDMSNVRTMMENELTLFTVFNRGNHALTQPIQQGSRETLIEGTLSAYIWNLISEKRQTQQ